MEHAPGLLGTEHKSKKRDQGVGHGKADERVYDCLFARQLAKRLRPTTPGVTIYQGGNQPYYDEQYVQEEQFVPQGYNQYAQNGNLPQQQYQNQQQFQGQQQKFQGQPQYQNQQQQYYQKGGNQQFANQGNFNQYQQYQEQPQDQFAQSQQRARSVGPENQYSYFVDKKGNYIPTSYPPLYTTGEPEGANYVPYSSYERRGRSVDPNLDNDDLRFKFGGMAFVDSEAAFYDVEGNDVFLDLNTHNEETQVRRPGDNYGLDFNESVYRGDQVDVEDGYQGYQAQKPRRHWTYCEDPFNPNNTYVDDLFGFYDPGDVVGDTVANHRVTVERELTDEERNNFCTEYIPTPGFLPQHRTEKPEPKEEGPICYSLSAKKELAQGSDYRPPSRSQSVGPVKPGDKKEVNLRNLLDDSAIQRQENVIQPAPWAPDSDYKQGRWQIQQGQLDPLNSRPQIPNQRPEWSQQVENKKNVWSGKAPPTGQQAPPERPGFWNKKQGAPQQNAQAPKQPAQQQQQGGFQQQAGQPQGNQVSTNYTYYQQGQQQNQQPSQGQQQTQRVQQQPIRGQQQQQPGYQGQGKQQPQQFQRQQQQSQQTPQTQQQQQLQQQQRGRPQTQQQPQQQFGQQQRVSQQPQQQTQQRPGQQPQQQRAQPQVVRPNQPQQPANQLGQQRQAPQQQQRTLSQPPPQSQNRQPQAGSYQKTITYVNGKPVSYEEVADRHQNAQTQPQNYQSVVYANGQPQRSGPIGGSYQQTSYYSQGQPAKNGGLPQQGGVQQGKPQQKPAGWNNQIPKGQLSNTQSQANGQYKGPQGQNVQYQRQVTSSANPNQQYQLIKQTDTQVRQQQQPSGQFQRSTETKYYKKQTLS
ncbi:unnamed protein product [Bursaphelenchus okinawaensis]|uniref:Uncharacterized protein n=1 Tax=Bursaphelenchus okinawaensis TaxID=465554 RepID=A0A811KW63_9BILA|nr:unnamed protein product [Bursaphelenchus okinawaensis]CAG9112561.1 unnamed protein product [Bursaphelenchus okinawaensis]